MHLIRRALALLMLLLFISPALAEDPLFPALSNPADRYVQSLCVLSQKDDVFDGVTYNKDSISDAGCQPISMANGVIAAFGVTARDAAVGVAMESMKLLVPGRKYRSAPVEIDLLPECIDPQRRASQAEHYPMLAQTVGAYPGKVVSTTKHLNAYEVIAQIWNMEAPAIFSSQIYVNETWEHVVRIAYALHEKGMHDATITLARAGAGTKSSGAPLRTGDRGHCLTLMLHVGEFYNCGAVYVLDSLPRALEGEAYGGQNVLRSRYQFLDDRQTNRFNSAFSASRIRPTVIKLALKEDSLAAMAGLDRESRIQAHMALIDPLVVFGACSMLISLR